MTTQATAPTPMEPNDLRDLLQRAGHHLFTYKSSDPTYNAERNLDGLTHYVDAGTRRYFKARILSASDSTSGLLFYVIESSSLDHQHRTRGFRGVVFDIFGTVVYRPSLDDSLKTREAARRAMYAWLNDFDVVTHYRDVFAARAQRLEREATEARAVVLALTDRVEA